MRHDSLLSGIGRPTHLQFAFDGVWEEAVAIQPGVDIPSKKELACLAAYKQNFALEVFFRGTLGELSFVGIRWLDKTLDELYALIKAAQRALERVQNSTDSTATLDAFDDALQLKLFDCPVAFLELGVNNLWKSTGSCTLWTDGDPFPTHEQMRSTLTRWAPHLLRVQPNELMLEIAFDTPTEHWIGLCVSRAEGVGYQLDPGRLSEAIGKISAASLAVGAKPGL